MIPVHLVLQGINSYQGRQEIDFTQLTEAGLFGIFGKVGSGKSTILEAITFALYGEFERHNTQQNRSYNLTNLKSDKLLVDFTFRAGSEGTLYRSIVEGNRSSKNFEEVIFKARRFSQFSEISDTWMPLNVENPAEKIIGLQYKDFKRTIIIPQGNFLEFLELKDKERSQMMRDLFHLERFDISDKVSSVRSRNDTALSELSGKLAALGDVSPELLSEKQKALENIRIILKINQKELLGKQKTDNETEIFRKLFEEFIEVATKLEKLVDKETMFQKRQQYLSMYQALYQIFKPIFDAQIQKQKDLTQHIHTLAQIRSQASEKAILVKNKEVLLTTLRSEYEHREALQKKADELGMLAKIRKKEDEKTKKQQSLERGENKRAEFMTKLEAQKNTLRLETESYEKRKETKPNLEQLTAIKGWFEQKENLDKTKKEILTEGDKVVKDEKATKAEQEALMKGNENIDFDVQRQALRQQTEDLTERKIRFLTQQNLQKFAHSLQDGQPCLLCGSVHHPQILDTSHSFETEISAIEQQIKTLQQQNIDLEKRATDWKVAEGKLKFFEEQKKTIRLRFDTNNATLVIHEKAFVWSDFRPDNRQALEQAIAQAHTYIQALEQSEKDIKSLTVKIEEQEKERETTFDKPLQSLKENILQLDSSAQSLRDELKVLIWTEYQKYSTEMLESEALALQQKHQSIGQQFETEQRLSQELSQQLSGLHGQIQTLENNIANAQKDLNELGQSLEHELGKGDFGGIEAVRNILATNLDMASENKEIQAFFTDFKASEIRYKDLKTKVNGQMYDAAKHQSLRAEIETLNLKIADNQRQEGALEKETNQIQTILDTQKNLLVEQTKLKAREENLKTLADLFKASGFVNYVSGVYLKNLCNQANERFSQMTRRQFELEIYESKPSVFDFRVRDLLNGGKTRSITSLSGGQKFQASLALALALADSVHQNNHGNFFFLDEGFGSLDRESLQVVFDTLKSLRKEKRVVGVISHVEDLQQEIDRYLQVSLDDDTGSFVEMF
jgi:DNA repair protein SbcC/Rad50